jgi:hydrogenase maturation protease
MAEVKHATDGDWKRKLGEILPASPVFVGVGREDRSDDRAGLELASRLREHGVGDVHLEPEIEEGRILGGSAGRPLLFIDAVHMGAQPGKISLLPLQHIFWNAVQSHRLLPSLTNRLSYDQIKNAYVLGIQPESIVEGGRLSKPVRAALEEIIKEVGDSLHPREN